MRIRKHTLALALALILALCVPALGAAEDPVVVRVGDFSYPLSAVQSSLRSSLDLADLFSDGDISDEDREAGAAAAIERFVDMGLVECKLSEKGENEFTDKELELIRTAAESKYEELWQTLYQRARQKDPDVTEAEITGWLAGEGYSVEAIYDEYLMSERNHRAIDLFCADVTLTQDQVDAYYEAQFVGPDRERYQNDVNLFEREIVEGNNESFYMPEGYRYVRQIRLDYPKAAVSAAKTAESRLNNAVTALGAAFQKLAVAVTNAEGWDDIADYRADYDRISEVVSAAQKAYLEKLKAAAQPLLQETLDAIRQRVDAGEDFKALIKEYSSDRTDRNLSGDGYLFHPDSQAWPEAFKAAAATLEKPGDVSAPAYSEKGVHILYYVGEAPAGDHALTEEERLQLNASALNHYQNLRLMELCEQWRQDYDIETYPELLKY